MAASTASASPLTLEVRSGAELLVSANAITNAPANDIAKPIRASFEGFCLKMKAEMNIENIGAVLTSTVAFRIVVSFTEDMKSTR